MMSSHQHNQVSEACPPSTPVMAYPPPGQAFPHHQTPPLGYPTTVQAVQHSSHIADAKSKGEGFWKGCVAAICCCWVLEFCCGC